MSNLENWNCKELFQNSAKNPMYILLMGFSFGGGFFYRRCGVSVRDVSGKFAQSSFDEVF